MVGFLLEDYSLKSWFLGSEGVFLSFEVGGVGGLGVINKIYKYLERTGKERLKEWGRRFFFLFLIGRKFVFVFIV